MEMIFSQEKPRAISNSPFQYFLHCPGAPLWEACLRQAHQLFKWKLRSGRAVLQPGLNDAAASVAVGLQLCEALKKCSGCYSTKAY